MSLLQTEGLSYDDAQLILETALGKKVRDCCFAESLTIKLSRFSK